MFIYGVFIFVCQTKIDLQTQGKNIDFSEAISTRPVQTGVAPPPGCLVGQLYFKSDAIPGTNLFGCTGSNWTSLSTAGGVPSVADHPASVLVSNGVNASWGILGGDISGPADSVRVSKIQNRPVAGTLPTNGQAMVWNATSGQWEPQTVSGVGASVSWETSGTAVGTRSTANLIAGAGLLNIVSDTGSKINIQQSLNTAVVLTKSAYQSGVALYCSSTSNSAVAYRCIMSPTLTAYNTPMVLFWKPDVSNAAGPVTLAIDGLDAKSVKLIDGVSDPLAGDVRAGVLYPVWYDGVQFRLLIGSAAPRLNTGTRPGCTDTLRGQLWHLFGANGQKDSVSVCAKDAGDAYDWRGIF